MDIARIPEHALRQIWKHQGFCTSHLHTTDGRPVTILSPGCANSDGGPDFLNASIRIGPILYRGDVELHCDAGSWLTHRHDIDPHYNRVILHVVLTDAGSSPAAQTASRRVIPLIVLHPFLGQASEAILTGMPQGKTGEEAAPFLCRRHIHRIPQATILRFLEHIGNERLELKIRRFHERLRQLVDNHCSVVHESFLRYHGNPDEIPPPHRSDRRSDFTDRRLWEQLLYEGIMECLGYEKNRQPFLALARALPLALLRMYQLSDVQAMMALLFGEGGLLPSVRRIRDRECRAYLLTLKHRWKELRPQSRRPKVHEGEWLFFRLRPANFPTARLAALCFLLPILFGEGALRTLVGIFKDETLSPSARIRRLLAMFQFEPDDFWRHHFHFRSNAGRGGITLGSARVSDIVVNCLIPVVMLYARIFNDHTVRNSAYDLFVNHPPLQQNSITRSVVHNILRGKTALGTAQLHQGALHLHQFYCAQERCSECAIGEAAGFARQR